MSGVDKDHSVMVRDLCNQVNALTERLDSLEKTYDQLSNWSVGIDLHVGEVEKKSENYINMASDMTKRYHELKLEIAELRDDMANLMKSTSDVLLKEINELKERLKVNEIVKIPIIESVVIDHREVLREFYSLTDSLASYFASKYETEIALTIRTHRKRIKEKLDSKVGSVRQTVRHKDCSNCYHNTCKEEPCNSCHDFDKWEMEKKEGSPTLPDSKGLYFKESESSSQNWTGKDSGGSKSVATELGKSPLISKNPNTLETEEKLSEPYIKPSEIRVVSEEELDQRNACVVFPKERTDLNGTDDSMVYHPEQSTAPEKNFEFQLVEKFIPPRGIRCEDCMNNPVPNLIEEFIDRVKKIADYYLGDITNYDRGGIINELEGLYKGYKGRIK